MCMVIAHRDRRNSSSRGGHELNPPPSSAAKSAGTFLSFGCAGTAAAPLLHLYTAATLDRPSECE